MSFGVVLGGGGPLGAAWCGGLGQGLVDAGFDLAGVDIFIGTSAGAVCRRLVGVRSTAGEARRGRGSAISVC